MTDKNSVSYFYINSSIATRPRKSGSYCCILHAPKGLRKSVWTSKMTDIVSGGALNSARSLSAWIVHQKYVNFFAKA